MKKNKKAIIFDLNGVFITGPYLSDRFHDDFGVSLDDFIPTLKEIMAKVRMPNAENLYSLWKPHLDEWGIKMSEEEFEEYWFGAEEENEEMTQIAKKLKEAGYLLFVLSNNFKERTKYYDKNFPFLNDIFEKVYYSWQSGFVKPEENAYKLILEENNLKPEECFYFDDSEKNIEVAGGLGIESYLFKNAGDVKDKIQ